MMHSKKSTLSCTSGSFRIRRSHINICTASAFSPRHVIKRCTQPSVLRIASIFGAINAQACEVKWQLENPLQRFRYRKPLIRQHIPPRHALFFNKNGDATGKNGQLQLNTQVIQRYQAEIRFLVPRNVPLAPLRRLCVLVQVLGVQQVGHAVGYAVQKAFGARLLGVSDYLGVVLHFHRENVDAARGTR
eukprot:CAMPEP_0177790050 /NCGR_PEP_ID=MMETSP0491_2-20121128/23116_1 /TAXON_ID=63592 /ORGANISM="Tetraselmis chuii, Strain PLY429" /LENGTH=188 /DNA_ID=CAMNT_0019312035 /DNA_START=76 /DNA_END=641 /DNA_ORIENTATION=+